MIDFPLLFAFLAAASILVITPGLDTAIVLRAATVDGRSAAIAAASGVALGCLAWGAAVSLGLGALLRASEFAYSVLKLVGAAYLCFIGLKLLVKPRSSLNSSGNWSSGSGARDSFLRGLLTNLLNPKVGVFYVTFIPQFVPIGANLSMYSFFLVSLHILLTLLWFATLIVTTSPLAKFLRQPKAVRTLDRLTGGIFLVFGVRLAAPIR